MEISKYSKIFKALSNEQRLKIFLMIFNQCCGNAQKGSEFQIKGGSCCPATGIIEKAFTKICGCMALSKSTVSHHLRELQNAGLIICEREGRIFRCRVNKENLQIVNKLFK